MTVPELGRLERVDLRKVWQDEAGHFSPWLARPENLSLLGQELGITLELEATERDVGPFRADLLCKDADTDRWVIIENQLERTDHSHLGQLLTYAAGLEASTIVWLSPRFTEEHRAALDWLNEITHEAISFFGVQIELWQIGSSPPAPKFNIVCKPNDWTKAVQEGANKVGLSPKRQLQLEFWSAFRNSLNGHPTLRCTKPSAGHSMSHPLGRAGFRFSSVASFWDAETNTFQGILRAELVIDNEHSRYFFEKLGAERPEIERQFGGPLVWNSAPDVRMARIYVRRLADLEDKVAWPEYFRWLSDNLERLQKVFVDRVKRLELPSPEPRAATAQGPDPFASETGHGNPVKA